MGLALEHSANSDIYLKFGPHPSFEPMSLGAEGALGMLVALSESQSNRATITTDNEQSKVA